MSLLDLQSQFASDVPLLIQKAFILGYKVTLGEAWRTPEQAQWNAAHGMGISNSLHLERLAIDLNLFQMVNGEWQYITDATGHTELGAYWKELNEAYRWGGDFSKKDFNHYSMTPDGIRE